MISLLGVFPGQGAQSIGMLSELAEQFPIVEGTFAEASEALHYNLWALVKTGPEAELNSTLRTQPALLAAGVAVWRVWIDSGGTRPSFLAGHSLGEYTALVCANAIDYAAAIRLVEFRAQSMQQAVPEGSGAMAALIGLADEQAREVCAAAGENGIVEAVNFNAPGQVVIAGERAAVQTALDRAKAAGAKRCIELPVSVPSHCQLMRPAADAMAERLSNITIRTPQIPVIQNVDVATHEDPDAIRRALVEQLHQPVRWVDTIRAALDRGAEGVLECGPGKVLAGLNRRIERRLPVQSVHDPESLRKALTEWGDKTQ